MKDKPTLLSLGLTLTFYGLLLLLNSFQIFHSLSLKLRMEFLDWRSLFLYGSFLFLIFKKDKTLGLLLLVIALMTRFNFIYTFISDYQFLFFPLIFLSTGIYSLFISLKK